MAMAVDRGAVMSIDPVGLAIRHPIAPLNRGGGHGYGRRSHREGVGEIGLLGYCCDFLLKSCRVQVEPDMTDETIYTAQDRRFGITG
jgi:hypothetical protein